jgi:hypothetical protein
VDCHHRHCAVGDTHHLDFQKVKLITFSGRSALWLPTESIDRYGQEVFVAKASNDAGRRTRVDQGFIRPFISWIPMMAEILVTKASIDKHRDLNQQLQRLSCHVEDLGEFFVYTTKVDYRHVTGLLNILHVRYGVRLDACSYMLDTEINAALN